MRLCSPGEPSVIRRSGLDHEAITYIYVVNETDRTLRGVVDLRDLVLSPDQTSLETIMRSLVVAAEENTLREDLAQIFSKYHYRMIPVADSKDHLLGIIRYNNIMRGSAARIKDRGRPICLA